MTFGSWKRLLLFEKDAFSSQNPASTFAEKALAHRAALRVGSNDAFLSEGASDLAILRRAGIEKRAPRALIPLLMCLRTCDGRE
ncbi:hypothetical protein [Microvirga sp. M2]|uniref:hypothetical protein n=1 Tax=Microvirga sp. M2 TaxID=3073270 RepID=UPI0039C4DDB6